MDRLKSKRYTVKSLVDISLGYEWNRELVIPIFREELVKKAYCVDQGMTFESKKEVWKWIWKSSIHPRISILLWRILNEALPTKDRLKFVVDKECPLCNESCENGLHLFKECNFAKALWFSGLFPIIIEGIPGENISDFFFNLISSFPSNNKAEVVTYCGCVFDQMLRQRNDCLLKCSSGNFDQVRIRILKAFSELSVNRKHSSVSWLENSWIGGDEENACQDLGLVRVKEVDCIIFTDASCKQEKVGLAAVMINRSNGNWVYKTQLIITRSAMEAELQAILMALKWAIANDWKEIHVQSDSLVITQALAKGKCPPDWKSFNISLIILGLIKLFKTCSFFSYKA
uniref:Uncharacterized protein n=1 Tax=Cannabis sativa TaxID=3483 RepID=A0A803QHS0_CANSA